jgi:DNA-binding PadR family transcriptional regulator
MRNLTNLEFLLLALLHSQPASGYALRKSFATTPLGHYSDSPGSIYPALQRLRRRGLLRPLPTRPSNGRRKQLFSITARGLGDLRSWLKRTVTREEVQHDAQGLMLRFVVTAQLSGNAAARSFVLLLESPLQETVIELESYLGGPGKALPLAGRLAVEQGLEGYRALARWASHAATELKRSSS